MAIISPRSRLDTAYQMLRAFRRRASSWAAGGECDSVARAEHTVDAVNTYNITVHDMNEAMQTKRNTEIFTTHFTEGSAKPSFWNSSSSCRIRCSLFLVTRIIIRNLLDNQTSWAQRIFLESGRQNNNRKQHDTHDCASHAVAEIELCYCTSHRWLEFFAWDSGTNCFATSV
jgi:hypothetical protein